MDEPICACKGIRSCKLCESTKEHLINESVPQIVFIYCDSCRQAVRMDIYESNSQCPHYNDIGNSDISFPIDGVYLVADFLSETEESNLLNYIDNDVWIPSQSGRLKQDFGIKINFKKQTIKTKYFTGMPLYAKQIIERFQSHRISKDFQPVELCNLDYHLDRGSHIDPHIDDVWIWGERLITVNLLSNTILSLIPNDKDSNKIIYVPIPRRWLIVLYGDARYEYKHSIQRQHIHDRRMAVTFRELTGKNDKFYEENKDLYERIVRIGKRFTGISVGRFEKIVNDINTMTIDKMEVDIPSIDEQQLKDLFESNIQKTVSSFEIINQSTYAINAEYLMKLFSNSSISLEQLQSILSLCQCNGTIPNTTINQSYVVIMNSNIFSSNKQIGRFLAEWRLNTRFIHQMSWKNPFDNDWFNQQYASIINKKKTSYPFLLSNLYTCQQEISSISENQLEFGLLWTNNQQSFYIVDLILTLLTNIDSFPDNFKEIIHAYEEILPLTNDEINYLDTFIRLQLVLLLNNQDIDDDKQIDLLEQLCSNICLVRSLVR